MKMLQDFYRSVMGDQLTFRNTNREWLYIGYLALFCLAIAIAYLAKN